MNKNKNSRRALPIILLILMMVVAAAFITKTRNSSSTMMDKPSKMPEGKSGTNDLTAMKADENPGLNKPGKKPAKTPGKSKQGSETDDQLILGVTIGLMEMAFNCDGKTVTISPEADKALTQVKKDGFIHIHLMEPFVKGYMPKFPSLPVQAIKLLTDRGFKVLLTINGSPFINGDTESDQKWTYRYYPGEDKKGKDDDGGLPEHKRRMTQFMDALQAQGLLQHMQFQVFDEPNAKRSFWGTFEQFEKLLAVNLEIISQPKYGISKKDIYGPAFTSKLVINGDNVEASHLPYWNFIKNYKQNPIVNQYPFSFNYYPVSGNVEKGENRKASDLKVPKELLNGACIAGMNVTAYMTGQNLRGSASHKGFRQMNTFKEKVEDIIQFAKKNHISSIYFFSLKNRNEQQDKEKGKVGTGLFSVNGCARKEYKDLLEILHKPMNFSGNCPDPAQSDD